MASERTLRFIVTGALLTAGAALPTACGSSQKDDCLPGDVDCDGTVDHTVNEGPHEEPTPEPDEPADSTGEPSGSGNEPDRDPPPPT